MQGFSVLPHEPSNLADPGWLTALAFWGLLDSPGVSSPLGSQGLLVRHFVGWNSPALLINKGPEFCGGRLEEVMCPSQMSHEGSVLSTLLIMVRADFLLWLGVFW